MDATKVQVKIYADNLDAHSLEQYVPVFHRWIRENALDEMLIDVADYMHVHEGVGLALVGHRSNYFIDLGEGRPGLLYSRKGGLSGPELFSDALTRALRATTLLAGDEALSPQPVFRTNEVLVRIPDRLTTRNDDASFELVKGALSEALSAAFGGRSFTLTREGDDREPLTIRARVA